MTNLLRKAAEHLPGHWHRGSFTDNAGNMCAVGHIVASVDEEHEFRFGNFDNTFEQWQYAEKVLKEYTNGEFCTLPAFNDADGTTEEDVVAFLEKAAVRWDEKVD